MAEEPNTETAFPAMTPGGYCTPGMTLRDWFAGQAISSAYTEWMTDSRYQQDHAARLAQECYVIADAMLLAREPKPDTVTPQHIALGIGGVK